MTATTARESLLARPGLSVPRGALQGRVVLHALDPSLEDEVSLLLVQRNRRDVVCHQSVGLVEQREALLDVQLDVARLEQARDLAVAVLHVVLVAVALPDFHGACGIRRTDPREEREVVVVVRQILTEVRACRLEVVQQLDSRLLRLILEEGEGKLTQLVAACRLELERQLRAAAPIEPVGALGAAVRLEDVLSLRPVVRPLRPVLLVGGVVRHEDRVVQRAQARVQLTEQRLHRRETVEAQDQRLSHPEVLRERVALRTLLDVDVLPSRTEVRLDAKTRLTTELGESLLRLRIDRVDLATTDLLDLRVGVGQELEDDPVELRPRAVPTSRVAGQRDAAAAIERRLEVRTVTDRLARLRVHDVVGPDVEQVRTGERMCRQNEATAEEVLPVRER